eukprot:gene3099-2081_t
MQQQFYPYTTSLYATTPYYTLKHPAAKVTSIHTSSIPSKTINNPTDHKNHKTQTSIPLLKVHVTFNPCKTTNKHSTTCTKTTTYRLLALPTMLTLTRKYHNTNAHITPSEHTSLANNVIHKSKSNLYSAPQVNITPNTQNKPPQICKPPPPRSQCTPSKPNSLTCKRNPRKRYNYLPMQHLQVFTRETRTQLNARKLNSAKSKHPTPCNLHKPSLNHTNYHAIHQITHHHHSTVSKIISYTNKNYILQHAKHLQQWELHLVGNTQIINTASSKPAERPKAKSRQIPSTTPRKSTQTPTNHTKFGQSTKCHPPAPYCPKTRFAQ